MDTFVNLSPWHWLILSIVLFAVEALGAGGFLLGVAVAAMATAILAWLDFSWQIQLITFGILSVVFSVAYWKYFRSFNLKRQDESLVINDKLETLKGKAGVLLSVTGASTGKVQLGDTLWDCRFEGSIDEGAKVIVDTYDGMILVVKSL